MKVEIVQNKSGKWIIAGNEKVFGSWSTREGAEQVAKLFSLAVDLRNYRIAGN